MELSTLEFIFSEINNITITYNRETGLFQAAYYIGNNQWTLAHGKTIEESLIELDKNLLELN